jgi:thymidine phosphorylase
VEVLAGGGPDDVVSLTITLAREMLAAVGITGIDPADALADGRGMDCWRAMITAQGGDVDADLPVARESQDLVAERDGVLTRLDAYEVGVAAWRLGAGRAQRGDPVSGGAGVLLHTKPGENVSKGQPLVTMFADDPARFARAGESLTAGLTVSDRGTPVTLSDLVLARIE